MGTLDWDVERACFHSRAKFLGSGPATLASFGSSNLQSDRVKLLIITFSSTPEHCQYLLRVGQFEQLLRL